MTGGARQSRESLELLALIGERVRGLRARRGMTRKVLAADSSVSERYLAQLEHGHGNISIARLLDIANALGVETTELMRGEAEISAEFSLIDELVRRLGPAEQKQALGLLRQKFSGHSGQRRHIALIGLRGAGKTTLCTLLAEKLEWPFVRLAGEIERAAQLRISEIFSLSGQKGYRRLEEQALLEAIERPEPCIIEAGGSMVAEPNTFNTLIASCFVVWVRAMPEEHMQRVIGQGDMRPMAGNPQAMQDLKGILEEREPYYAQAHAILDTSNQTVSASFDRLWEIIAARPAFYAGASPSSAAPSWRSLKR